MINFGSIVASWPIPPVIFLILLVIVLKYHRSIKGYLSDIRLCIKSWVSSYREWRDEKRGNKEIKSRGLNEGFKEVPRKLPKVCPVCGFYAVLDVVQVAVDRKARGEEIVSTGNILKIRSFSPNYIVKVAHRYVKNLPLEGETIDIFEDHKYLKISFEIAVLNFLIKSLHIESFVEQDFCRLIAEDLTDRRAYRCYKIWHQFNDWLLQNKINMSAVKPEHKRILLLNIINILGI
ncbi:hypothetical protein ES702_02416 [subsurface metagenome]